MTGIFTVTDCSESWREERRSSGVYGAQLHPHSHHRPLHSIPIRPGLISISVVTAARGLSGCMGPHSPSVRAQPHLPPSSHRSRPKLFSYFSCDSRLYSNCTHCTHPPYTSIITALSHCQLLTLGLILSVPTHCNHRPRNIRPTFLSVLQLCSNPGKYE